MLTFPQVVKGRTPLRCECGEELFVEEFDVEGDGTRGRFVECTCGNSNAIHVPPGSVIAGFEGTPFVNVWGPAAPR